MRFISQAGKLLSKIHEETVLPLRNVTVIETEPKMIVSLPTTDETSFRKGDKLMIMVRDEPNPIGQFRVVLNDRHQLVGDIRWPDVPEELRHEE